MSRMFLLWSLLFGLALAGADWWADSRQPASSARPSYEGGTPIHAVPDSDEVSMMEGGKPLPAPPK